MFKIPEDIAIQLKNPKLIKIEINGTFIAIDDKGIEAVKKFINL